MKRITYLFVLLAVSFGYSQEIVVNGDFESCANYNPGMIDCTPWYNNGVNPVDDGSGNFVNEVNVMVAGNPWDVNISQEVTLVDGETYTFSFDAYTATTMPATTRTIIVGIGNAGDPFGTNVVTETITDVSTTYSYTLEANYGSAATNSRVIFDMGADTGFVYIDNVSLTQVVVTPTCTDGIMNGDETGVDCGGSCPNMCPLGASLPIDFETATTWEDFDGGEVTTIANSQNNADNNSANVGQMVKGAGETWGGSSLITSAPMDFANNDTFSMKVFSPNAGTKVLLKVENAADAAIFYEQEVTMTAQNAWETLTFNYSGINASNSYDKLVLIFDNGTTGDGSANFTYLIDDITLFSAPAPPSVLENFDGTAPTVIGDNGIVTSISSARVASAPNSLEILTNGAGDPWQGAKLLMQNNKIDMTTADKTLTVDVYSMVEREYLVKLSNGDANPAGDNPALESKTFIAHPGGGWVTLVADFNNAADTSQPGYNPPNDQFSSVIFFPLYDSDANADGGWNPVSVTESYIDNVTGIAGDAIVPAGPTCTDGIMNGDETGVDCGGSCPNACPEPDVLPTTAPPTPPNRAAADVISIYGTAYGTAVGLNNVPWDDSDFAEETIAGNELLRIDFGNFLGTNLGTVTDASAMTHFHIDYWIANPFSAGQVFNQKWSNHTGGSGETDAGDLTIALPGDGSLNQTWVSLDIPLTEAAGWFPAKGLGIDGREALTQYIITTAGLVNLAYVDNIYLHKNTTLSTNKVNSLVFAAYPNPSNGKWQVQTKKENIETVKVYDIQGKQMLSFKPNAANFTIDGSKLSPGLYLAKIESRSKTQTLKLIKN